MKSLVFIMSVFCILILSPDLLSQNASDHDPADLMEVRIHNLDRQALGRLIEMNIDIDGVFGSTARAYVYPDGFEMLQGLGYDLTVVPDPLVGNPGLRVGYHTHSELTAELQAIAAANPTICELYNIGDSTQGRALWFMKISDNVGLDEDEPEFKYISTMHGDEPVGMELCMNLINLLVDGYGSDPQITDLVNDCEIWIMPLMNPDGYTSGSRYNAQGRDLNRDFPDRVTDPNNTTTGRGTETRHVMNWAFDNYSVLSANFHTGALVVNYPYDSDPDPWASYSATPDDDLFIEQSLAYSIHNGPMYSGAGGFYHGITNGAAWYVIYGGMQDWNYVWMGCNEVTIELSQSKWPPYSQIAGLWDDNRDSMLAYMELCLTGVRGVVTNSVTGQPVAATVKAVDIDHDVFADPDVGNYHRMLLPGTYSIEFSADGYITQTVTGVSVGSGDAVRVDVQLVPEASVPVPDIKINGSDDPGSIPSTDDVEVQIYLDPGDFNGVAFDWWIWCQRNSMGRWWYDHPGQWIKSSSPIRASGATLRQVNGFTVLGPRTLPAGIWDFHFAVDEKNGIKEETYMDSATVIIY